MKKFLLCTLVLVVAAASLGFAGGQPEPEVEPVELDIVISSGELLALERQMWDLYEEENPHVTIRLSSLNEDQYGAFAARVAGGDAPAIHFDQQPRPTADNYRTFVDLQTIDYPYWDLITSYDNEVWKDALGADYVPGLIWKGGRYFSFIYYEDEMREAGFSPRDTVRTWDQLDAFLADLKDYIDSSDEYDYVLDMGWHPWVIGAMMLPIMANGLGGDQDQQEALFRGEISWTDEANNPFVPALEKLKEWTERGYLPDEWWTREWEAEFEAGFIAERSILTFHGPWLWSKVEAENPDGILTGFPMPTVNGVYVGLPLELQGSGIYAANQDSPEYDEIVKAFIWAHSPEIMKLRAEIHQTFSTMDLSSVGGAALEGAQARTVAKPIADGFFGDIEMDFSFRVEDRLASNRRSGAPMVFNDNQVAMIIGNYVSGRTSLQDTLRTFEQRWRNAYTF